ncbi:ATP-dependent DNA ligase [Naasia lichenicola]|uniref:DNA ligase (ATP) n=1 Tax=Naasia lichenicola TaxID=2565933 RepID=A0A4S4FRQ1_9MICO|nr:ATP-dependent DNA ligase [Naasia lichenicola]THG32355.1 ATP-dependent DNA ligase [Naasia lichenicola]
MAKQSGSGELVSVDGHRLKLTNLDKVLYPETGTTKADVLDYYARIADVLIPHARDRALTRKRWVHGVGTADEPGQVFFQKNLEDGAPSWVKRREIEHSSGVNTYPLLNDRATLTWLAQLTALELHVPQWRFGRNGARHDPDRIVLDLDPGEGVGLAECAEVARHVKDILEGVGLDPMPVTSGSKGIHLYAHLDGTRSSDEISAFAHELARALEADLPDLVVSDMKKTLRTGKVLVDWSQNNGNKTTIAPYSLRGRLHPMVAAPRTWDELDSADLRQLDYEEVLARVEERGDLLAALDDGSAEGGHPEDLRPPLEPTPERTASFQATPEARDRLATYRSMRDAAKTPEPVPAEPSIPSDGRSFVIQEHHARRLHWDFRLENDGVLVSWALPKGVPTSGKENHLAVHTEDHPLEYGTFEGSIPAGEYGGGEVTIWDAGTYELEKWRDDEVIAVLHGRPDGPLGGPVKVALIRTARGGDEKNWLIHRMALDAASAEGESTESPAPKASAPARTASGRDQGVEHSPGVRTVLSTGPMLATLGTPLSITASDDWAFEMKWDGIRALVEIDPGSEPVVRLTSRNGNDLTKAYPELAAVAEAIGDHQAVLDAEIVALDRKGRPDFGRLQQRMNLTKSADIDRAAAQVPVVLMVFDLLELDGHSLLRAPYVERRERLVADVASTGLVQVPPAFDAGHDEGPERGIEDAMAASRELGLEGVVAKKLASTYTAGRRSAAWVKLKHTRTQEVVIGGWRPGKGRRADGIGSLLLGIPGEHGLVYVGRVGTGFGDRDLDEIGTKMDSMSRKTSPFADVPRPDAADAHWVTPQLVGEVEFAEWTSTGRLRQPSWRGWRPDKSADDVVREGAVGEGS